MFGNNDTQESLPNLYDSTHEDASSLSTSIQDAELDLISKWCMWRQDQDRGNSRSPALIPGLVTSTGQLRTMSVKLILSNNLEGYCWLE